MPFTISHPAIIIPLKKIWPQYFSLTGLMAGAMAPDLLYFLILTTVNRGFSHSWIGLILFCVPAGIAFSFAFHYLFKSSLITNLPSPLDRLLSGLAFSNWRPSGVKGWSRLIFSITIGVLSHFFWDSFTHVDGELAVIIPILSEQVMLLGHSMYYARVLQHLSTICGGLTVLIAIFKCQIIPGPIENYKSQNIIDKFKFWIGATGFTIIFMAAAVSLFNYLLSDFKVNNLHVLGLSSWAGFYWYVIIFTLIKRQNKSDNN